MVALCRENILMFVNFAKKYLELHKYQLYFFKKKTHRTFIVWEKFSCE